MGKTVFELYVVVASAALLVVVEDRSVEKCSDKLDPDVFRNVVSVTCLSFVTSVHRSAKSPKMCPIVLPKVLYEAFKFSQLIKS